MRLYVFVGVRVSNQKVVVVKGWGSILLLYYCSPSQARTFRFGKSAVPIVVIK